VSAFGHPTPGAETPPSCRFRGRAKASVDLPRSTKPSRKHPVRFLSRPVQSEPSGEREMRSAVCILFAFVTAQAQPDDARKLNSDGLAAYERGAHAEAEQLHRKAVELWEKMGPDYEAHLATSRMNLAQALSAQGRRVEAAATLEES